MSDMGDYMREYREDQQKRRAERLPIRQAQIESLSELGYTVKRLTDYQFRVNDLYDLYPIHNRWHDLKTGARGGAKNLKEFIIKSMPL